MFGLVIFKSSLMPHNVVPYMSAALYLDIHVVVLYPAFCVLTTHPDLVLDTSRTGTYV